MLNRFAFLRHVYRRRGGGRLRRDRSRRIEAGADQSAIVARLGPPKETYDLPGGGKRLMWPTQPMGTTTTAADIDASGNVLSVRQVLHGHRVLSRRSGQSGPGMMCS